MLSLPKSINKWSVILVIGDFHTPCLAPWYSSFALYCSSLAPRCSPLVPVALPLLPVASPISAMNTGTIASPRRIDDTLVRLDSEHRSSANEILHTCLTFTGIVTWNHREEILSWEEHFWNRHCGFVTICNSTVWLAYPETTRSRCVSRRVYWRWH